MDTNTLQQTIEKCWDDRSLLEDKSSLEAIEEIVERLDKGKLRVAEPDGENGWKVNTWVKKAVVLYFPTRQMETIEVGPFEFHDKIPLKKDLRHKEYGSSPMPLPVMVHSWKKASL